MQTVSKNTSNHSEIKGTVRQYQIHPIMHYFTGNEIITEPKVCIIYGTCVK